MILLLTRAISRTRILQEVHRLSLTYPLQSENYLNFPNASESQVMALSWRQFLLKMKKFTQHVSVKMVGHSREDFFYVLSNLTLLFNLGQYLLKALPQLSAKSFQTHLFPAEI